MARGLRAKGLVSPARNFTQVLYEEIAVTSAGLRSAAFFNKAGRAIAETAGSTVIRASQFCVYHSMIWKLYS